MGREIRRVPANWNHPRDKRGHYIPLKDNFNKSLAEWIEEEQKWNAGLRNDWEGNWKSIETEYRHYSYSEWAGKKPIKEDYMPDWLPQERTHFQMYEDTSEGTPISPVMPDEESLAHWLADNKASAFGNFTASYEEWLATIKAGYAVGMILDNRGMRSGVEFEGDKEKNGN